MHDGEGGAKELHFIDGYGRIEPILRKLPRDGVLHLVVKVHIKKQGPELNKLGEMTHSEVFIQSDFVHPSILFERMENLPILSLGNFVDEGAMAIGFQPLTKERSKKASCTCCQG
jgi:hypothetical protein